MIPPVCRYVASNADNQRWVRDELKDDDTETNCGYSVEIYDQYAAYGCPGKLELTFRVSC